MRFIPFQHGQWEVCEASPSQVLQVVAT